MNNALHSYSIGREFDPNQTLKQANPCSLLLFVLIRTVFHASLLRLSRISSYCPGGRYKMGRDYNVTDEA